VRCLRRQGRLHLRPQVRVFSTNGGAAGLCGHRELLLSEPPIAGGPFTGHPSDTSAAGNGSGHRRGPLHVNRGDGRIGQRRDWEESLKSERAAGEE